MPTRATLVSQLNIDKVGGPPQQRTRLVETTLRNFIPFLISINVHA
jgi:hypothetical protein